MIQWSSDQWKGNEATYDTHDRQRDVFLAYSNVVGRHQKDEGPSTPHDHQEISGAEIAQAMD